MFWCQLQLSIVWCRFCELLLSVAIVDCLVDFVCVFLLSGNCGVFANCCTTIVWTFVVFAWSTRVFQRGLGSRGSRSSRGSRGSRCKLLKEDKNELLQVALLIKLLKGR